MVGAIVTFSGSTIPNGYLACDGSAVSRTTYSSLFSLIGTTYGVGDGSTTFNLPNLEGKVAIGSSQTHLIGTTGGYESVQLQTSELPSHTHEVPQHGHSDDLEYTTPTFEHTVGQPSYNYSHANGTTKMSTTTKKTNIYTARGTANMSLGTAFAVGTHSAATCTKTGSVGVCSAFDTTSTGGGLSHNNMMPYLSLKYIIAVA